MTNKSNLKTAVVIPNWNGEDYIENCIKSLLGQSIKSQIIVVDNGSVDKSLEIMEKYKSTITILSQQYNLGFAGGVNVGIKYAIENNFTYIALLNNDAVSDRNWVEELIKAFELNDQIKIVASKILKDDKKTIDSIGNGYTIFGSPYPIGRNEIDEGQYDSQRYVFGASGGAAMYSVELFKKIGLFDEDFFAYYEEDDLNFRAQLAGYRVITAPKAIVYHEIGGTSTKIKGFTAYQTAKNFWMLYTKNMPGHLFWKYLPLSMLWYTLMFVDRTRKGLILYFLKGLFVYITLLIRTFKKRVFVQKGRVVKTKYIDSILYHSTPPRSLRKKSNA